MFTYEPVYDFPCIAEQNNPECHDLLLNVGIQCAQDKFGLTFLQLDETVEHGLILNMA